LSLRSKIYTTFKYSAIIDATLQDLLIIIPSLPSLMLRPKIFSLKFPSIIDATDLQFSTIIDATLKGSSLQASSMSDFTL